MYPVLTGGKNKRIYGGQPFGDYCNFPLSNNDCDCYHRSTASLDVRIVAHYLPRSLPLKKRCTTQFTESVSIDTQDNIGIHRKHGSKIGCVGIVIVFQGK